MSLLILTLLSAAPAAAAFSCDDALEQVEEHLGDLDGRPLRARLCTNPAAEGQHQTLLQVHWEAPLTEAEVWQDLRDGLGPAAAGDWVLSLAGPVLTASYPSGVGDNPSDQRTRETWRWDFGARRFGQHTLEARSPWSEGIAAMNAALDRGDLDAARAALAEVGPSPDGGRSSKAEEIYLRFLQVTVDQAMKLHRAWQDPAAAALVSDLLQRAPVSSPTAAPAPDQLALCVDGSRTCEGLGRFIAVPRDAKTGNLLAAAAFALEQGERDAEALPLLDLLLKTWPQSPALYLTRADALWDLGREEEARQEYRRYRAMQPGGEEPKRIRKRLGPDG